MTESSVEPYLSEEYCCECDATIEIMSDRVGTCPECGAKVIPCNSCAYSAMLEPLYEPDWSKRCDTDRCPFATGVEKYEEVRN